MDNASTHMNMSHELGDMICERGAFLLYTAPYSPDLSPIEYAFNVYKSMLKRWSKEYKPEDWYLLHKKALSCVSCDKAIKEFRQCEIPFSDEIETSGVKNLLSTCYTTSLLVAASNRNHVCLCKHGLHQSPMGPFQPPSGPCLPQYDYCLHRYS